MAKKDLIVQRNNTESKKFEYSKGNVNLSFTLRTDIKNELKIFLELLNVATKDVQEELDKK